MLFCAHRSVYLSIPGLDRWDERRDARSWPGGTPIVAHPPCRLWGKMRFFAGEHPGERALAPWALEQVRRWGGVLEHPEGSGLWAHGLRPGEPDEYGGWVLPVDQSWWGHRARKRTWLYVQGVAPSEVPPIPLQLLEPSHTATPSKTLIPVPGLYSAPRRRPALQPVERSATPRDFALFLVSLARACRVVPA